MMIEFCVIVFVGVCGDVCSRRDASCYQQFKPVQSENRKRPLVHETTGETEVRV